MQEALKSFSDPFFIIDSTIIKMKPKEEVFKLFAKKCKCPATKRFRNS